MNAAARALALGLAAWLGGCALLEEGETSWRTVDEVIAESIAASRAPAIQQKAALARAQQSFSGDPNPVHQLRLATLLALLPGALRDDARAGELLQPLADPGSPGVGRLAALLAGVVAERQRLAREAERASREAERAARERERTDKERERMDRERERAERERDKREEALKQQLEALRSIERGILEREERLRRKTR